MMTNTLKVMGRELRAPASVVALMMLFTVSAWAAKIPEFVEWTPATPRFADLGLNPADVADIVGDGQMVIVQPPREIDLWTKGEVKHYTDVRFATAVAVVKKPVAEVRRVVKNVTLMESFMPQIEDSSVIAQSGNNYMAEWTQVFDLPGPVDLKAKFHLQHTEDANGDINVLLHKGDIEGGTSRWEFAPIDDNTTLLAFTYWGDLDSAGLGFRILLNSQPELIPAIPAIAGAMVVTQYQAYLNEVKEIPRKEMSNQGLPLFPRIPMASDGSLDQSTLEKLASFGTPILIHPKQYVAGEDYPQDIRFVSAINIVSGKAEEVAPLSADFANLKHYFSWTRKAEKEVLSKDSSLTDLQMKVSIGPLGIKVDQEIQSKWKSPTIMNFMGVEGDLDPLVGVLEYLPVKDQSLVQGENGTLIVDTMALEIGDDAGFLLKMVRNVPLVDMIAAMYMSMTILEKQEPWMLAQLKQQPPVAAR